MPEESRIAERDGAVGFVLYTPCLPFKQGDRIIYITAHPGSTPYALRVERQDGTEAVMEKANVYDWHVEYWDA